MYIEGIQPIFNPLKAHCFDSSWNWASQDALVMFYDSIFSCPTTVDREITAHCITLLNHVDPELLTYMQYHTVAQKTVPMFGHFIMFRL